MSKKTFILVLLIFQCVVLYSQSWTINHYSKNNILPSNFVNDLAQDEKGALIVATDVGLYRFNGSSLGSIQTNVFYKKVVTSGAYLFGLTKNNKIHFFENFSLVKEIDLIFQNDVIDLALLENKLFALTAQELVIYDWQTAKKVVRKVKNAKQFLTTNSSLLILLENKVIGYESGLFMTIVEVDKAINSVVKENSLLVVSTADAVFTYLLKEGKYDLLKKDNYNGVKKIALLQDGGVLMLQENLVQVAFNGSTDVLTNPMFFNSHFHMVFKDNEGGIWLSEKGTGLFHIPNPEILRYQSDGVIKSVTNWNNQTVFSSNAGLIIRNTNGKYNIKYTDLDITDCKPYENQLLLATLKGVYTVDSNLNIAKVSDEVVNRIEVDKVNQLLYGTTSNKGLAVISLLTKEVNYLQIKNGLSHNIITDIERASKDTLLLCTPAGGIEVVAKGKLINNHRFRFKERVILNTLFFNHQTKELYCATPNNGLFIINRNNKVWRVPFAHSVYSIFELNQAIWVTHDAGISILKDGKNIQIFEPNNPNDFFPFANGIYKSNKTLFLGIHEGFLKITPRSNYFKKENAYSYQHIIVNDKKVKPDSIINLSYGKYRFKFLIDFINLSSRNNGSLEWRMKGYNEAWNSIKENTIEFPSLNYGFYHLEIRTTNGELINELGVDIYIDEPFWLKAWFWLIMIVFVALLVYFFNYFKTKSLIRENNKLERVVEERTIAISRKNEALKQFAYVVSHDFKNPVVNISQLADIAIHQTLPGEKQREVITHIKSSSDTLHKQLLGMIELLKVDADQLPLSEIDVPKLIDKIVKSLDSFMSEAKASIIFNTRDFKLISNEQYLYSIVYNILSNAVKYRSPERDLLITVDLQHKSGKAHVSIQDNGLGFNVESQKDTLFQPFRRIHKNGEGTGIGLALTKSMVYALNGTILVRSKEGEGSTFELIL